MPISRFTLWLCKLSSSISLATLLRPTTWALNWGDRVQVYVLGWLFFLALGLAATPIGGPPSIVVLVLALYRLQDLVFAITDDALELTCRSMAFRFPRWRPAHGLPQAPIAILLTNVFQVILIFAILYSFVDRHGGMQELTASACSAVGIASGATCRAAMRGPFDYLYLSWTSLFTLGGGDTVSGTTSRVLVMLEVASSLLVVGTGLATFVARGLRPAGAAEVAPTNSSLPCGRLVSRHGGCSVRCRILDKPRAH